MDPTILVDVPPREGSELVPVARMTARFDPVEVFLEKGTGDLYLAAMEHAGEAEFEVGPCELFGFGLGASSRLTSTGPARRRSPASWLTTARWLCLCQRAMVGIPSLCCP